MVAKHSPFVMGVVLAALAPVAQAAEFHVASDGDNANPGSDALPWRTIAHAVASMDPGDTTYVHDGTYEEGEIRFRMSGSEDAPIELLNAPGEAPIIHCIDPAGFDRILIEPGGAYNDPIGWITIAGFEIRNCFNGIKFHNLHDSVIRRNWIHTISSSPILGSGTRILIDHNVVSNGGTPGVGGHGFYIGGSEITITNNLIYDNHNYGIQQNGSPSSHYDPSKHAGPEFADARNWIIANNTFAYGNNRAGIVVWGSRCHDALIENNLFYENGVNLTPSAPQGVDFVSMSAMGVTIRNNFVYATEPGATGFLATGDAVEGTHYTVGDNIVNRSHPAFVDAPAELPAAPNFGLTADSGAIDVGIVNARTYNGEAPDAGAFETFGVADAEISGDTLTVTLAMNLNTPVIVPDAAGWSVSCNGTACGVPIVDRASPAVGSDRAIELRISGIEGGSCASDQTWSVAYDASAGAVTDSSLIGSPTKPHNQPLLSFAGQAVANDCARDPSATGTEGDAGETTTVDAEGSGGEPPAGTDSSATEGDGGSGSGASEVSDEQAGCSCAAQRDTSPTMSAMLLLLGLVIAVPRRRKRALLSLRTLAVACGATTMLASSSAGATDYFISPGGDDDNSCASISADEQDPPVPSGVYRATLGGGLECLSSGDRLVLRGGQGTYVDQEIRDPVSGTEEAYTTIMAMPRDPRPVIAPDASAFQRGLYIVNTAAYQGRYIRVEGLEFDSPANCASFQSDGPPYYFSDHIHWIDNICHDTRGTGMQVSYDQDDQRTGWHLFKNSEFYNIGSNSTNLPYRPGYNTIYGTGHNSIVEGNVIHDSWNGIALWQSATATPAKAHNVIVRNNRLYRMGRTDLHPEQAGSNLYSCIHQSIDGSGNQFYNNLCYDSGSEPNFVGIRVGLQATEMSNTGIYNNTIYNLVHDSAAGIAAVNAAEIKNNIVYQAGQGIVGADGNDGNNFTIDPEFVDAEQGDFHLMAGGPAVDQGLNLSAFFAEDFDGVTRPEVGPWEVGAFEIPPEGGEDTGTEGGSEGEDGDGGGSSSTSGQAGSEDGNPGESTSTAAATSEAATGTEAGGAESGGSGGCACRATAGAPHRHHVWVAFASIMLLGGRLRRPRAQT